MSHWIVTAAGAVASESLLLFLFWSGTVARAESADAPPVPSPPDPAQCDQAADTNPSEKIDRLIKEALVAAGQNPNPIADDATFLRRAYLDLIGRIPTLDETRAFLSTGHPDKRASLVDRLLESSGYALHQFSYWADLLRAKSDMPGGPSDFYTAWIKQSLRENTPYDQWVREMLTAQGYVWSTPAAGYFQRDQAMPLDNMANTVQVFLGTRLECAQCHNHPFEAWTRHDFYRMAAYRHHLSTVNFHQAQWPEMQRLLDQRGASKDVRSWASRTFALLKRRVYDAERQLQLPEDYTDDDAQPGQVVQPATIFGDATCGESVCDHQQAFAEWLASPHNPHFTTVITNRMWKKVMGRGLIEPVDDMNQSASASHPELLQYLETLMVENQYDLRQFQRVLYNTRTYQRAVCSRDLVEEDRYYFPGPPLKQMTAEQLWDSLMTLMAPDIDLRQGERFRALHYLRENLCGYERATPEELVDASYQAAEVRRLNNETQEKLFALEKRIAEAEKSGDADIVKQLRAEVSELEHYSNHEIPIRIDGRTWLYRTQDEYRQAKRMSLEESLPHVDSYWSAPERNWCVRAAELSSPADSDHPLRTFGQSDREQIDNASSGPTIPLALTLMNGEYFKMVHHAESMLMRNVRSARSPAETVEVLYLTLLSRFPSEDEAQVMAAAQGHAAEPQEAVEDAAWALINTREFMFVR